MIQLEKYNKFLEIFKYARLEPKDESCIRFGDKNEDERYSSKSEEAIKTHEKLMPCYDEQGEFLMNVSCKYEDDDLDFVGELSIEITLKDEDAKIIKMLIEDIKIILLEAKSEFLNNLYNITLIEDKRHFLNITLFEFVQVYRYYFDLYNEMLYRPIYIPYEQESKTFLFIDLQRKCFETIKDWVKFIHITLSNYNIILSDADAIRTIRENTFDYLNIFELLYGVANEINIQSIYLRDYFKVPEKYDLILELPYMKKLKYFDEQGNMINDGINKTQKQEISRFLHFLNNNSFLKKKYLQKNLYEIAQLFDISLSTLEKNRDTSDFVKEVLTIIKP